MEILYLSKSFVIINKPVGMPSQKDPTGAPDAMTLTAEELSLRNQKSTLFLVHRLDRVVGGALVFARTKAAAAAFSALLSSDNFVKEYLAICEGNAEGGTLTDLLFKDSITSKAYVVDRPRKGAKEAELSYQPIEFKDGRTLVKVRLKTGRFHQIRVQFASRGHSLVGDGKYGNKDNRAKTPALFAHRVAFGCLGERVDVTVMPEPQKYPFSLFSKERFE
ncbi:MAG: RNA pseudouridine synthase [Clostridia bacterium]|nr:RNA pseudouridine synthase [Clostridia bacterium]